MRTQQKYTVSQLHLSFSFKYTFEALTKHKHISFPKRLLIAENVFLHEHMWYLYYSDGHKSETIVTSLIIALAVPTHRTWRQNSR